MGRLAVKLTLVFCCAWLPSLQAFAADPWQTQRETYQAAINAFEKGQLREFRRLKDQLKDYPLHPYLVFYDLNRRLPRLPADEVDRFLERYSDTPMATRLRHRWLIQLAKRGRWQLYQQQVGDNVRDVGLRCYSLWATHKNGDTDAALRQTTSLWLVGYSQPKACDPLFKLWTDSGYLTDELAWKRFSLAMRNRKTQLARYLIRFMSPEQQALAQRYREIHRYPQRLLQTVRFKSLTPKTEEILLHGLGRLARKDALLALELWQKYQQMHPFSASQSQQIAQKILLGLARENEADVYHQQLTRYAYPKDVSVLQAGINMAIRLQRWPQLIAQIERLPKPSQKTERMRYWYARALLTSTRAEDRNASYRLLTELAQARDYYGFIAADLLGEPYRLNHQSYAIEGNFLETFKRLPGIVRAHELYKLDDPINARREWQFNNRGYDSDQHYAAAHYAAQIGWHVQAISSAIRAERWNDLTLRFPVLYEASLKEAARRHQLDANWLFAIARQESALVADARSPKGAMGLMQLLPSTAKEVAGKHNLRYRRAHDLLKPEYNIKLGSAYVAELLAQFNNLTYALAAYNAGPHRVKRWLKDSAALPIDAWIENIPFAETRRYVKNVMAYSVIFADRRNITDFRMATAAYLTPLARQVANNKPVQPADSSVKDPNTPPQPTSPAAIEPGSRPDCC